MSWQTNSLVEWQSDPALAVCEPAPPYGGLQQPPRLLDQLRERLRRLNYSIRTEQVYVDWARRFILYHGKRHPREMGAPEIEAFLTHLAVGRQVSAATQNQARAGLLFLYREVLGIEVPWLSSVIAAKTSRRLPVVLTEREVRAVLLQLGGGNGLVVSLLYGTGMRLLEGLRLRIKDVEFERREVVIRSGKGDKDRVSVLPENLIAPLQQQMAKARALHQKDLDAGYGEVWLPDALARKFPRAGKAWGWQFVFLSRGGRGVLSPFDKL
jgi:integron integrase